jgi:hypothetical protein
MMFDVITRSGRKRVANDMKTALHLLFRFKSACGAVAWMIGALAAPAVGAANGPFVIRVVDEQTGGGVPLIELRTVHNTTWWTDSAGRVAFEEPGLMDQEVYFHVRGPGYEYPKDFFGNRGVKLRPVYGGRVEVKVKRIQIAERLYRITGAGIYRDSVLAGEPVPLRQPVLNGLVLGQDTVIVAPYRGKLYWCWGDTEQASYPLGNFGASGATSELPGRGGLDPSVGVDLVYFTNTNGFSRPMCPEAGFGAGLKWIEGLMTVRENGPERLLARVAAGAGLGKTREWHLALFNDEQQVFQSIARWDIHDGHDSAHPFHARVNGVEYVYLYPNLRVRAEIAAMKELTNYEAFTCVSGDGKAHGKETTLDHDDTGRVRYSWKAGAERLQADRLRVWVKNGVLKRTESWFQLFDSETGAAIEAGRGSVFWNEYRRRWVMIAAGKPGEVWFSEADTPTGPWVFATRVAEHGRYNFYNPTQHPFFDQPGVLYFEGTYTDSFSGAPAKTPRYDYNQLMYRLALDDPRLDLPAPVYLVQNQDGAPRHLLREGVEKERAWDQIKEIKFFGLPGGKTRQSRPELVPVWAESSGTSFLTNRPPNTPPLFLALPVMAPARGTNAPTPSPPTELLRNRDGLPLCRVWKNPLTILPLDLHVQPLSSGSPR